MSYVREFCIELETPAKMWKFKSSQLIVGSILEKLQLFFDETTKLVEVTLSQADIPVQISLSLLIGTCITNLAYVSNGCFAQALK